MWFLGAQSYERFLQPSMKPLDEPIGFRVIRGRHQGLDAPRPGQLLKDFRGKLRAPVCCDGGRYAVMLNPPVGERVGDALGRDVGNGDGYGPSREAVYRGQQVAEPVREWEGHDVDVDVFKTSVRNFKVADGRNHMSRDLCLLALEAFSSPAADIASHRRPDHFGLHHLSCAFNAGVTESVEKVEDPSSVGEGDIGSSGTVADVHYEGPLTNVDGLEVES